MPEPEASPGENHVDPLLSDDIARANENSTKIPTTDVNNVLLWILEWVASSPYSTSTNEELKKHLISSIYEEMQKQEAEFNGGSRIQSVMYDLPMNLLLTTFSDKLESTDGFKDSHIPLLVKTLMVKHSERNKNLWSISDVKSFLIPIFKEVILSNFRVKECIAGPDTKPTLADYEIIRRGLSQKHVDEGDGGERRLLDECIKQCQSCPQKELNEDDDWKLDVLCEEDNGQFWKDVRDTIKKIDAKSEKAGAKAIRLLCDKYPDDGKASLAIENVLDMISETIREPFLQELFEYTKATNYSPCDYDAIQKEQQKRINARKDFMRTNVNQRKLEEARRKIAILEEKLQEQRTYKLPHTTILPDDEVEFETKKSTPRKRDRDRRNGLDKAKLHDDTALKTDDEDNGNCPMNGNELTEAHEEDVGPTAKKSVAFEATVVANNNIKPVDDEADEDMEDIEDCKSKDAELKMKQKMDKTVRIVVKSSCLYCFALI